MKMSAMMAFLLLASCPAAAPYTVEPAACVPPGSVCSSITPCCVGHCTKVGNGGTRYDWQCR